MHPAVARPGQRPRPRHLAAGPRRDQRASVCQGPVRLAVRAEPLTFPYTSSTCDHRIHAALFLIPTGRGRGQRVRAETRRKQSPQSICRRRGCALITRASLAGEDHPVRRAARSAAEGRAIRANETPGSSASHLRGSLVLPWGCLRQPPRQTEIFVTLRLCGPFFCQQSAVSARRTGPYEIMVINRQGLAARVKLRLGDLRGLGVPLRCFRGSLC